MLLDRPVVLGDGGGADRWPVDHVGEERLKVAAGDVLDEGRPAGDEQVGDQFPAAFEVGLDGGRGAVDR
jgi:hypothetical protein